MLPSLYASGDRPRPWSVMRAAAYGAAIGAAAAMVKSFGPFHAKEFGAGAWSQTPLAHVSELAAAALAFAFLCAAAAALRNAAARRLVWREHDQA